MRYINLRSGEHPPPLSLPPFKALVVLDDTADAGWRSEVCAWLVSAGCLSFAAWGEACEGWHDEVDNINITEFEGENISEDRFIMTTWHANETLSEAIWFVANAAFHPITDLKHALVVHVAPQDRASELLKLYRAAADQ